MRTRTPAALAAVPLALALALSGCGSDDAADGDDGGVASVTGESSESDSGGSSGESVPSEEDLYESALDFAECMRKHGVDMEDPEPDGMIQLKVPEGGKDKAERAMEACQDLMPKAPPKSAAEERSDMLKMAKCMRENGVEKFPDPKPGEGIKGGPEMFEDPDFESAQAECDDVMRRPGTEMSNS